MAKIVKDVDKLASIVKDLKAKGKKIVLVNGCFDILHVGHIRYLKGAKMLGDVLVAALNSDISVRALKGSGRPLTQEGERMEILSAIRFVDYVTIFSEPTVDKILLKIKPHIHAKGTDYTIETVPERQTVLSYGGEIAIVGDPKEHSSSEMAAIKNR
ncbi:MAG TPA: adenylyltransferase/cytidyltransferase family protein [Candidatus Brocadiia bacterium]|nr:adenylyltransferase/cytidyltransferase family protein [Planctomycetota bacterium]